jgi:hypothetical protein
VLDMLGVRYVLFSGTPPAQVTPLFRDEGYWVLENPGARPRAFVPERVETVPDEAARLAKLGAPDFDPARMAYVEVPVDLPAAVRGSATIAREIPTDVAIDLDMQTPGLVVLADLWDPGWRAFLDGRPVSILRANHAVRGVVAPAGRSTLEFRYEPASRKWGVRAALAAGVAMALWLAAVLRTRGRPSPAPPSRG